MPKSISNDTIQVGPWPGLAQESAPSLPSPEEGRRLVVAFICIKNAAVRDAIVNLTEKCRRPTMTWRKLTANPSLVNSRCSPISPIISD
jgi:hypothetical protein